MPLVFAGERKMQRFRDFLRAADGYVTALALIAMPLLLGFALLVIDVGRGNNLHTDLQNAVDAIALAGARELNGGEDSITRAEAAMTDLLNNQARMGDNGTIAIGADEVEWHFLSDLPASDDDPIDLEEYETTNAFDAAYVWVISNEQPMTSLFPIPVSWTNGTVDVRADAVATYDVGACDVTPLFICNPFEGDGSGQTFQEAFADGKLYSRVLTLHIGGGSTIGPGNYGWLNFAGSGGDALRDALATGKSGECYGIESLETKPGATVGAAEQGMNVRFGLYGGGMKEGFDTRPALNVRKGAKKWNECKQFDEATDGTAMGLPSTSKTGGSYSDQTLPGGTLSGDNWRFSEYWDLNHDAPTPSIPRSSDPAKGTGTPSRYDVYRYEIDNNLVSGKLNQAPNKETGDPGVCYKGDLDDSDDRRVIFAAVADCNDLDLNGSSTIDNPTAFVSLFLTKPMLSSGSDKTVSAEVIDVTGFTGNSTLETFIREEATLVR